MELKFKLFNVWAHLQLIEFCMAVLKASAVMKYTNSNTVAKKDSHFEEKNNKTRRNEKLFLANVF